MHKSLPILTSFAVISTLTACTIPGFAPKAPEGVAPAPQATSTLVAPMMGVATGATIPPEMLSGAVRPEGVASGSVVPGAVGSPVGIMPDGTPVTIPPITTGSVAGSMPPLPPGATVTPIPVVAPTEPVKPVVSPAPVKLAPTPVAEPVKPTPVIVTPPPAPLPPAPVSPTPAPVSAAPKTISKVVTYSSPGGMEDVGFTLTVDNTNTVTDMTVAPKATNGVSSKYQSNFAQNAPGKVIGQKISGLKISAVSGGSLTTGAFNEFVAGL